MKDKNQEQCFLTRNDMYRRYCSMHSRCYNKENSKFHRYGLIGIYVCHRWHNFDNYFNDLFPFPKGMTLDRIDNKGPYSPENTRIASYKEQARNKGNNHKLTFEGKTLTMTEWSEIKGIKREALRNRLKNGWSVEEALTIPVAKRTRTLLQEVKP